MAVGPLTSVTSAPLEHGHFCNGVSHLSGTEWLVIQRTGSMASLGQVLPLPGASLPGKVFLGRRLPSGYTPEGSPAPASFRLRCPRMPGSHWPDVITSISVVFADLPDSCPARSGFSIHARYSWLVLRIFLTSAGDYRSGEHIVRKAVGQLSRSRLHWPVRSITTSAALARETCSTWKLKVPVKGIHQAFIPGQCFKCDRIDKVRCILWSSSTWTSA